MIRRFMHLALTVLLLLTMVPAMQAHASASGQRAAAATVLSERWLDSNTVDVEVRSSNVDAWSKNVRLIVPNGWSKTANRTWPTMWLLHGGGDDYRSWDTKTDLEQLAEGWQVIVVMPDTSWCSAYSDWDNYGKGGKPAWETYLLEDVRGILESKYRAGTQRAIGGLSMGGLGALKFPEAHPGMFQAAASFSGNVDPLHEYDGKQTGPDLPGLGCLADWKRVWGDYRQPRGLALWERNDPYHNAAQLSSLDYLYVSSGDGQSDPIGGDPNKKDWIEQEVYKQTTALHTRLNQLGIPHDSHFGGGWHDWIYWQVRLHEAWPGLMASIGATKP